MKALKTSPHLVDGEEQDGGFIQIDSGGK